jgi:hypothetical protein
MVMLDHRCNRSSFYLVSRLLLAVGGLMLIVAVGWLQGLLDQRQDQTRLQIEGLAQLPKGEYLRPALLGYHHLGADILWLKLVQVIGKKRNSDDEYEWMAHALDVITTLDPQYAYAYYVGGVLLGDLAQRPDLSNQLLERGVEANPGVWNIPFILGYNYYFLMGDSAKGAKYIMRAATLPDRPAYLPGLATRLSVEAGSPATALSFLEARLRETQDQDMRAFYVTRMKEVLIERDILVLERVLEAYRSRYGRWPRSLRTLVAEQILSDLPQEPFGGEYVLDTTTGQVTSSTHPDRLITFYKRRQSSYVFPKTWE